MGFQRRQTFVVQVSVFVALILLGAPAGAQIMIAQDDFHGVRIQEPLVVDAPGLLDNDLLDGEAAAESGAIAELVVDAVHGTLVMTPDGAFSYSPGPSFTGLDSFVYAAVAGAVSDQATVHLIACNGGPDVFVCWEEEAFLSMAGDLGYYRSFESLNGPAWDPALRPGSAMSVTSQGVRWTSNYPDAPVSNPLTVNDLGGGGNSRYLYDPNHGYAEGTAAACDNDFPAESCLYHDGFTGEVVAGNPPLVGVSAIIDGDWTSRVSMVLDDVNVYPDVVVYYQQFLGIIDTRPQGFSKFSFRETAGKVGQGAYIWGHDISYLTTAPAATPAPEPTSRVFFAGAGPNPASRGSAWRFSLPTASHIRLDVYDIRGRLVRSLAHRHFEAGEHGINWDARDAGGHLVAAGTYFGRLKVDGAGTVDEQVRKIVILR